MLRIWLLVLGTVILVIAGWRYFSIRSNEVGSPRDLNVSERDSAARRGRPSRGERLPLAPLLPTGVTAPLRMISAPAKKPLQQSVAPVATRVSLAEEFGKEEPGGALAISREELVRDVVQNLAELKVGSARTLKIECRALHCMLHLAGENMNQLVKFVDALQDERGFLGKAQSLMLSRSGDDIIVYLRFATAE